MAENARLRAQLQQARQDVEILQEALVFSPNAENHKSQPQASVHPSTSGPLAGVGHGQHRPNGLTKADRQAEKYENLIQRDFMATKPNEKFLADITEIPCSNGKPFLITPSILMRNRACRIQMRIFFTQVNMIHLDNSFELFANQRSCYGYATINRCQRVISQIT